MPQVMGGLESAKGVRPYFPFVRNSPRGTEVGGSGIWGIHFGGWKTMLTEIFDPL